MCNILNFLYWLTLWRELSIYIQSTTLTFVANQGTKNVVRQIFLIFFLSFCIYATWIEIIDKWMKKKKSAFEIESNIIWSLGKGTITIRESVCCYCFCALIWLFWRHRHRCLNVVQWPFFFQLNLLTGKVNDYQILRMKKTCVPRIGQGPIHSYPDGAQFTSIHELHKKFHVNYINCRKLLISANKIHRTPQKMNKKSKNWLKFYWSFLFVIWNGNF